MKPLTKEWVEKAEGDFDTANRELRARRSPNYDSACFHSQQCGEKYLKARLQEAAIRFPFTHDLEKLLAMTLAIEPLWSVLAKSAEELSKYAVKNRYPGASATREQAKDAVKRCGDIRVFVRQGLGLK
jgi:HEPN domain-containing protein